MLAKTSPSNGAITQADWQFPTKSLQDCGHVAHPVRLIDGELMGCVGASINWWLGNQGNPPNRDDGDEREKYRCNSWAYDTPERRGSSLKRLRNPVRKKEAGKKNETLAHTAQRGRLIDVSGSRAGIDWRGPVKGWVLAARLSESQSYFLWCGDCARRITRQRTAPHCTAVQGIARHCSARHRIAKHSG